VDAQTLAWCRYLTRLETAQTPTETQAAWAEYRAALLALVPRDISAAEVRAALEMEGEYGD